MNILSCKFKNNQGRILRRKPVKINGNQAYLRHGKGLNYQKTLWKNVFKHKNIKNIEAQKWPQNSSTSFYEKFMSNFSLF